MSGFSRTIVFGGIAVEALRIDNRGARRCRATMVGRSREGLRAVKWRDEGLVIERSRRRDIVSEWLSRSRNIYSPEALG